MEEMDILEEEPLITGDSVDEEDLSYDEEGNIIIPEDDLGEEETEDEGESESEDEVPAGGEVAKEEDEEDEREAEIDRLRKELSRYKTQGKDTLSKLGIEADDVIEGLIQLAAEANEQTPEEYKKEREEKERHEEAEELLRRTEFEKTIKADLDALHTVFPETRAYQSVKDIPNVERFANLRDLGLSAVEAYSAANSANMRNSVAYATKRQSLNESKSHLRSVVPKASKDYAGYIPRDQLNIMRSALPGKSDREIYAIYKKVT